MKCSYRSVPYVSLALLLENVCRHFFFCDFRKKRSQTKYKHVSEKSKKCLSVGNSVCHRYRHRLCPRLHQLIQRPEIFTKSAKRRIFDFQDRFSEQVDATLPYMSEKDIIKVNDICVLNRYLHQTFTKCVSNQ